MERESADWCRSKNGQNDGHFGTKAEELLRLKEAGSVEEPMPTKRAVAEIYLYFVKVALKPVSTERDLKTRFE